MWYRRSIALLFALVPLCSVGSAGAQAYPTKLMRIVTAATGSANDWGSRVLAQELTASFGQQVIVENIGGASGQIALQKVARARPDGSTLLFTVGSFLTVVPAHKRGRRRRASTTVIVPDIDASEIPSPPPTATSDVSVRITGIDGLQPAPLKKGA